MKLTLNKTIEARRLNKRNMTPLTDPEVAIPYGAIVEYLGSDRDFERFTHMGEPYHTKRDVLLSALEGGALPVAVQPSPAEPPASTSAPKPGLRFEALGNGVSRAKVPGGWLVRADASITFLPDPSHEWDGASQG